jgi:hypothetical protein
MNVQVFECYSQNVSKRKEYIKKGDKIAVEIIVMDYKIKFWEYYGTKIKTVERVSKNLMKLTEMMIGDPKKKREIAVCKRRTVMLFKISS